MQDSRIVTENKMEKIKGNEIARSTTTIPTQENQPKSKTQASRKSSNKTET